MERLNADTQTFVERWGLVMERMGAARTFGRLMGLLLVADKPLSLDQIAKLLHVSKASASTNGRLCEQMGFAKRVGVPGDRRTYYTITPTSFEQALSIRLRHFSEMVRLTEEGMDAVDGTNSAAKARLATMQRFYSFIDGEMKAALKRWQNQERPAEEQIE
jgi:DNA-binding transcriptional regulator GbsR (MarR family)